MPGNTGPDTDHHRRFRSRSGIVRSAVTPSSRRTTLMSASVSGSKTPKPLMRARLRRQLADVEQVALVDRQGAAERGVVDPGVAGEVDAPDRMSGSHPDARGQVHRPARAGGLHFGREIEAALRLGATPQSRAGTRTTGPPPTGPVKRTSRGRLPAGQPPRPER